MTALQPIIGDHFRVGQAGHRVWLEYNWRILDIGSGHAPHKMATVLLERSTEDGSQRSDGPTQPDHRLVIGDAQAMPFEDRFFEYAIASHVAEHVEDPAAFCRELTRVARAGYIETPGWLGDMLLREPFNRWRVRRKGRGLLFEPATPRPSGTGWLSRQAASFLLHLPGMRRRFYTELEWSGSFPFEVSGG